MQDVNVTMTGCVGACRLEPMADVITAQGEKTTYVNLNPEKVRKNCCRTPDQWSSCDRIHHWRG